MTTIQKDITTVTKGFIVHQVNCQGVMGSGVAKALVSKWPVIFDRYADLCRQYDPDYLLGCVDVVEVDEDLHVVNLFGQDTFGHRGRFTSYAAWERALQDLVSLLEDDYAFGKQNLPIHFPLLCGCDRGGGDWRIVSAMIEERFPNAIFCEYP